MLIRTKIIATIGPACRSHEKILELIEAGMNVARLNFSHGDHQQHQETIEMIKTARDEARRPVAIMLDTKGPEVRVGKIANGGIDVVKGQQTLLVPEDVEGNSERMSVNPGFALDSLGQDMRVLFDDGYVGSHVLKRTSEGLLIEFDNNGRIATGKSVNVPNVAINLPAMTDRDISDIRFGIEQGVELIAASFIRSAEHVLAIRRLMTEHGGSKIRLLAKVENAEGVQNIDQIIQTADGVMIARGDLGVEMPLSQVPRLQKMMIRKCYMAGKPSVTATQMLESMIQNPRPTRAEASDVANAIYDGTSAVMLSGETAVGKYPIESVNVMKSIVYEAESDFDYREYFSKHSQQVYHDVTTAVTLATVKTAYSSGAKAIFAFTSTGSTARMLSRFRPEIPIVALTPIRANYHQLAFNWGVVPAFCEECTTFDTAFSVASAFSLENEYVRYGDLVVITAGTPFGISGTTNMMVVDNIGDVLIRGHKGFGRWVYGKVALLFSPEDKKPFQVKDYILVVTQCDDSYLPLLKQAAGIVLQNHVDDIDSEQYATLVSKTLDIPVVVRADGASDLLKEEQMVTLDPPKALVYNGVQFQESSRDGES